MRKRRARIFLASAAASLLACALSGCASTPRYGGKIRQTGPCFHDGPVPVRQISKYGEFDPNPTQPLWSSWRSGRALD